ncbi:DUF4249 family protein [Belliella kenyensis]|uniref:DUF4249 family protein n=1 Tax=Belliella kenyensis TaxID=1472724 RepID=A0ABV8EKT0_9BACT|nr:DUF4249 family protein [Belliella kenyensis]MCH7403536.1 DUF4249 domain-containing protein [Belliella kenyensis]MDN3604942.1 DUF4249 family protein [Belliella kenyensis]
MKRIFIAIFIAICFSSCQEEVVLDLNTLEPIPVIEAIWTNVPNFNQVTITTSREYYDDSPNEVIEDAQVSVRNLQTGRSANFIYNEQLKKYLPSNNQIGQIGQEYELSVIIKDKAYVSKGVLLAPPILDSITYEFKDQRVFRDEGYYITLFGDIPFDKDNYYRLRVVKNDTLLNRRSDYLLFDDTFGTQILNRGFELGGFTFAAGDRVRLELFRLNKNAYDYLSQLVSLLFNDGGLFSPPPQNPVSNIFPLEHDGNVLGYFMVSPYIGASVLIEEED